MSHRQERPGKYGIEIYNQLVLRRSEAGSHSLPRGNTNIWFFSFKKKWEGNEEERSLFKDGA